MPPRKVKTPEQLPLVPLRSTIVYPLGVIGVQIGMPGTLEMLARFPQDGLLIGAVVAPGGPDEPIEPKMLEKVAVLGRMSDRLNMPGGSVQATVQGIQRLRLVEVSTQEGYFVARTSPVREKPAPEDVARDLIARILNALEALSNEVERISREVPRILRMNLGDPGRFVDLVATLANFSVNSKDEILQRLDIEDRLQFALNELEGQLRRVRKIEDNAATLSEAPAAAPETPSERAGSLRQQIKVLQSELGEIDPVEREVIELLRRVEAANLPARVAAQARTDVERLRSVGAGSPDASEIRSYIDWLLHMPWREQAQPSAHDIDLQRVREELDAELVGLVEQKERILDYLAVSKLRGDLRGPILCIVGPPEVGKSALVAALGRGLGRPLARLELGGRGEAQIVGTRRTRAGAQPGKIAAALRSVGVRDPVFVLQEMDEIGLGKVEGDPIEAMEEVLTWDMREGFVDRYIDLPFDLADVLFVATAQDLYKIPRDLRNLMLEIRIAGYTAEEKVQIARYRMLPKLIEQHGVSPDDVEFTDESLFLLAQGYARDSGLGNMGRAMAALLRTRARAKAQGDSSRWTFDRDRIEDILGLPRYVATPAESHPEVGVVTGLAWTAGGGELMFIEALRMPGTGRLIITGMLGDVMRESVNAAYSYVRSRGEALGIDDAAFRDSDVHVHFPVGAIPKDGPSAGIAVTLAIASTLSNRPVRHDIAMSGEVTLRGKVLEIGGVKEKTLAAYRAGLFDVILPRGNQRDLRDVPADIRDAITFHFVDRMDEVVGLALIDAPRLVDPEAVDIRVDEARQPRAARSAGERSP
jgi:ATP-dependent Lon protease